MMFDPLQFFQGSSFIILSVKIPLLIFISLYIIFTLIVISRVRALNRAIHISSQNATSMITFFSYTLFILAVSLFLVTLVIV